MLNIALCDDDQYILDQVSTHMDSFIEQYHMNLNIEVYHNGDRLISAIQHNEVYDIIFMDIEMDGNNGISVAKYIRNNGLNTIIIFISSYDKYMMDVFEVEPFRFIRKPIDFNVLQNVFLKAIEKLQKQKEYFEYYTKGIYKKVFYKDIIYFESKQRQIIIHAVTNDDIFYAKLNDIEKIISGKLLQFIRIHQSYYVNYNFIKVFSSDQVTLFNGETLKISEDRKKNARLHYFSLIDSELFK